MAKKQSENFLERIPVKSEKYRWTTDENNIVTIEVDNKGVFNRIFQILFKKPKISYIHLDENGSFVWSRIDGEKNIIEIGKLVEEHFGDAAKPVYERLTKYFAMLSNAGFVEFKK